jgi:hypothetical protein
MSIKAETIVDLKTYPIDQPESAKYRSIVEGVKEGLSDDGCVVLPNFLSDIGLNALAMESEARKSQAYYSESKECNIYLGNGNPNVADSHPQNIFMERSNGFITADLLGDGTYAHALYYWRPLREFLAACLGKKELHIYADPISNMIVNLCRPQQTFNWHFDTNEFTITFLLKGAESGGHFEYVPNLRTRDDECFDKVKKVLSGDRSRIKRLDLKEGDLQFFLGRYSLHQVTHNTGSTDRLLLIQSFTEMPGVIGNPFRVKDLYGKTTSAHKEKVDDRSRSDRLLD